MIESLTISKQTPEHDSMDYAKLREIAIARIQELAGLLWTDYNSHDPGVTMLEVFSYVITDIGYRANFDIKDILTQKKTDTIDIKNFYTACEILPVCPVTFDDYRKLLIDVEVVDETDDQCAHVGVKNAWMQKSVDPSAEQKIYVDRKRSKLSLSPIDGITDAAQEHYYVKVLYDVLLEFDKCDRFGDLNSNISEKEINLALPEDPFKVEIRIDFKRWDELNINWDAPLNIGTHIEHIRIRFPDLSSGAELVLEGGLSMASIVIKQGGLTFVNQAWLDLLIPSVQELFDEYALKVQKIFEIVDKVRSTLNDNRNLCDDFHRISALKVEEILICADIELTAQADVEEVEAEILYNISKFLSPTVYFYTLDEMLNRCHAASKYSLESITKNKGIFTISVPLEEDLNKDDTITVLASETNMEEYTVKCIRTNRENPNFLDIEVIEDVSADDLGTEPYLIKGTIDEDRCLTVDKIFEGPKLKHGFIDDEELQAADRMKYIRVSDIIRIIMDVEGVVAVQNIQIANQPQDNDESIESKSVKWCLELAVDKNYVPRLNSTDSSLTYYKENIPFIAKEDEVNTIIDSLESEERQQKIYYPYMDIPVPTGDYMDLESYSSLQEDFPQVYGVGSKGIPGLEALDKDAKATRKAQAVQLKGFLLFFDQLMANYVSQLEHVKDIFSMNNEKDEFGEYKIDKTYFSQPLYDVVPNADPLYVNKVGHLVALENIVEDKALYEKRRNKFLDHLLGRFAESFTDYALLIYKATGAKAASELIEDKLNFLDAYPDLSASRGKAFNYLDLCEKWHVDNVSGLEKRASLLLGMPTRTAKDLVFGPNFVLLEALGTYTFEVVKIPAVIAKMQSPTGVTFNSEESAKLALESVIMNGSCRENYKILPTNGGPNFTVFLICDGETLAESNRTDFTSDALGGDADDYIKTELIEEIMLPEYCHNAEANRKNLAMPILNYVEFTVVANLTPPDDQPPRYEINYSFYSKPFEFEPENLLMEGTILGAMKAGDTQAEIIAKGEEDAMERFCELIGFGVARKNYGFDFEDGTMANYTIILCNRYGVEIGRSPDQDYNDDVANEIDNLSSNVVEIGDGNLFTVASVLGKGPDVEITLTASPPVSLEQEKLKYNQSFSIISVDLDTRSIEISIGSSVRIFEDDEVEITGPDTVTNLGAYTIKRIETSGPNTILFFQEELFSDDVSGELTIHRSYEVKNIDNTIVTIIGLEDERAISEYIEFFIEKFASNEGMHIIEHTLLRPRINELAFMPATETSLLDTIVKNGDVYFRKTVAIVEAKASINRFIVSNDITNEIDHCSLKVIGSSPNDGDYTKISSVYYGPNNQTFIDTKEDILFDIPDPDALNGELSYVRKVEISNIIANEKRIVVTDIDVLGISPNTIIEIKNSRGSDGTNDGLYIVQSVVNLGGGNIGIQIEMNQEYFQDTLLPINLDEDECESCNQVDPYSCVISVVLPFWAGKLTNLDIRKFVEKTIRLESPAHLLLNICWINCEQIAEFECKYKKWLIQIGKQEKDTLKLVNALDEFINIIGRLRNIYPSGTLHSCDDDDTFEGSIILNNSVLGTF